MRFVRWSDVVGHITQVQMLRRACASERRAHAFLLTGPESVGKTHLAWAMTAHLTCLEPSTQQGACGRCRSCNALKRGAHPEVNHLVRQGASIKIDQVRALREPLRYEATLGRCRVVLIEGADWMNETAANALLKTLEEPSASVCFVLVSSRPQRLLSTIVSRSQQVRLTYLSFADVAKVLELEGVDATSAVQVSPLSQGQLSKARSLCDAKWLAAMDVVVQSVLSLGSQAPLGVCAAVDRVGASLKDLSWAAAPSDQPSLTAPTGSLAEARLLAKGDEGKERVSKKKETAKRSGAWPDRSLPWVLETSCAALRDALHLSVGRSPEVVALQAHVPALRALAERASPEQIMRGIDVCLSAEKSLAFHPSPPALLESTWLKLGRVLARP